MAVFKTDDFVLVDHTDQTKALNFNCSGLAAATLQTLVAPTMSASTSLVLATCTTNVDGAMTFGAGAVTFLQLAYFKDAVTTNVGILEAAANTLTGTRQVTFIDASGRLVLSAGSPSALLAATRIPFVSSTSNVLTDDTNLTYSSTTGLAIANLNAVTYDDDVVCADGDIVFA